MFLYVAKFDSCWLGGNAVILADNEDNALKLLNKEHFKRLEHKDVKFTVCPSVCEHVIYYDNGDY